MTTTIAVMTSDLMRLAAQTYDDATGFVAILQENAFGDYRVNDPVVVNTVIPAVAGQKTLLFPPTTTIQLADTVYCPGIDTYSVVIGITQNYAVSARAFCSCKTQSGGNTVPPQGDILSTLITISPPLDNALVLGSPVTFTVGYQTVVALPDQLPVGANGAPT